MKFYYLALAFLIVLLLAGCMSEEEGPKQDSDIQREIQERVRNQDPIYQPQYSQTYKTVNEWSKRWDSPDKVSYVYLLADTGNVIGYYVLRGRPVSMCVSLSKPYEVLDRQDADLVVPAPALDGVYYNGGDCNNWYGFTADTDAYIEFGGGLKFWVSDQPLSVEAEEIRVAGD